MKATVVLLRTNPHDHYLYKSRAEELVSISRAIGYDVENMIFQTRKPDPKYLLGKGKIKEISGMADAFIFWNPLTSRQKYDLERALDAKVIDRSELILELFARNAHTPEAKLQIHLAQLRKQFPYERYRALQKLYTEFPGPRAAGEYAYRKKIRQLQSMIRKTSSRLEKIRMQKRLQRVRQAEIGPIITITGFYNAGKSTLFNTLVKGKQEISEYPFTTLASKVARFYHKNLSGLLIDSIGMVQDMELLHEIVASFELTFDDVRTADLVLCLFDCSEEIRVIKRKILEAGKILKRLDASDKTIKVFNKMDKVGEEQREMMGKEIKDGIFISAKSGEGLEELKDAILENVSCL
jgi:GTP-binding protein HflX